MRTYEQTVAVVYDELTESIERVRILLGADLAKFGTVDIECIAERIVADLSWQYGTDGRH